MAVTISLYNHTRKLFANNEVDLSTLKLMLRNDTTVFNAAHEVPGDLAGAEVSGGGWSEGGEAIASAAVTVVNTNEAMLDGDNISVQATGAAIGPAHKAVIVAADFTDPTPVVNLLAFVDFDGAQEAGEGTPFNVNFHENGIARWLQPS